MLLIAFGFSANVFYTKWRPKSFSSKTIFLLLQWNLDLRKPDLRKNLDLRKTVETTKILVHNLFDLRKILEGLMFV